MKALSIRQPWAWAILCAGKDVENRNWGPKSPAQRQALRMTGTGELFLIHASSGMTHAEYERAIAFFHDISRDHPFSPGLAVPAFDDFPRGGIVGQARIWSIQDSSTKIKSPWFFGPIGLSLFDVKSLQFIPCKGSLGFFNVPDELVRAAA